VRNFKILLAAPILGLLITAPAFAAPDEQTSLRAVANIARLAIDPVNCVDPDTTAWTLGPPPATYFDGGTPNQKMLVRVWHYGWALRTRPSDLADIRATLLDFINRQQQVTSGSGGPLGHYATTAGANEELTSSHYQLWSGAMAAAYLFAIADGGTLTTTSDTSTAETAIRDAVRKWWADEQALYDRIYTNGQLDAPGARFSTGYATTGPLLTNTYRDDIYKLLQGLAPVKVRNCSSDRYYTASFVMQSLKAKSVPRLGQPPAGYTTSPKLYDTLCVYRMGSDWTLYFPTMRSVTGGLYWVEYRNSTVKRSPVPYDGSKPTSYPAGLATLESFPGVVAGAATCPQPDVLNQ
jgi:hypothetical protein